MFGRVIYQVNTVSHSRLNYLLGLLSMDRLTNGWQAEHYQLEKYTHIQN